LEILIDQIAAPNINKAYNMLRKNTSCHLYRSNPDKTSIRAIIHPLD
jgi:hypothetical protein